MKTKVKLYETSIRLYSISEFNSGYFEEIANEFNLNYECENGGAYYVVKLSLKLIGSEISDLYFALIKLVDDMRHEYGDDGCAGIVEFV